MTTDWTVGQRVICGDYSLGHVWRVEGPGVLVADEFDEPRWWHADELTPYSEAAWARLCAEDSDAPTELRTRALLISDDGTASMGPLRTTLILRHE